MAVIRTVLGDVPSEQAGITLAHEHILYAYPGADLDHRTRFDFEEIVAAADRVVQRWRYDWGSGHVRGVDLLHLRDGRIAEKLSYVKG